MVMVFCGTAFGQIFQENWDGNGPGIMAWTIIDGDGNTPAEPVNYVTDGWVVVDRGGEPPNFGGPDGDHAALSTSWYDPAGASNDWLISPQITIPAGETANLVWDAKAQDPLYPDGYELKLAPNGGNTIQDFTVTLFSVESENPEWITRSVPMSAYAGQTIRLAWVNNSTDMFVLLIDNIGFTGCMPPSDFDILATTETSAEFSFTSLIGANGANQIIYGPFGFDPETEGTVVEGVSSPYMLEGLDPLTAYQVYVRSDCDGSGNWSDWTGPFAFNTTGVITVNQSCDDENAVSYNFNTTEAPSVPNVSCVAQTNTVGYVYSFVAPDSGAITLNYATLSGTDIVATAIYNSDMEEVFCQILFDPYYEVSGLVPGETYSISLFNLGAADSNHNICISALNCPQPGAATITETSTTSAVITIPAMNGETNWDLEVVAAGENPTGTPTHENVTSPYTIEGLMQNTAYDVYWRVDCSADNSNASIWSGPVSFRTSGEVDCAAGPMNVTYCYGNSDTTMFGYQSLDGSPLRVDFNAGVVEANYDAVIVYDSDGTTVLFSGDNDGNDFGGMYFISTGDQIFIQFDSDGIFSCGAGQGYTPFDFDVSCSACAPAVATATTVADCANNQFSVEINVSSMGSGDSLTVSDDQGSEQQTVTSTGTVTFGPYTSGTPVSFTIVDADEADCVVELDAIYTCPVLNDNCDGAISVTAETGVTAPTMFTNASLTGATDSGIPAAACDGWTGTPNDDVWFSFEAVATSMNITFPETGAFDGVVELFSGACGELVHMACADTAGYPNVTIAATDLVPGETYYFRVYAYSANTPVNNNFTVAVWTSEILGVNDIDNASAKLNVYPNPVRDILSIRGFDAQKVTIYNMAGQHVKVNLTGNTVNVAKLPAGNYVLQAENREGEIRTVKFIKK